MNNAVAEVRTALEGSDLEAIKSAVEKVNTELQAIGQAMDLLGPRGEGVRPVFISVDPERDTPQALMDYLSSDGFPDGTIGLTGTPEQVAQAARAYRAFYQKVGEGEGYTMNHALTVYVMGSDGKFRTTLGYGLGPQKATQIVRDAMARG